MSLQEEILSSYSFDIPDQNKKEEADSSLIAIKPLFSLSADQIPLYQPYFTYIDRIIKKSIPEPILHALLSAKTEKEKEDALYEFHALLPLLNCSDPQNAPTSVTISFLSEREFTFGTGRYLTDMFSRWLIPGKFFSVNTTHSLSFQFVNNEKQVYFFFHLIIEIESQKDIALAKENIPKLLKEIRLTILAVRQARAIIANEKLSLEQKRALLEESLISFSNASSKNIDSTIFDQMHHFLLKLSGEQRISEIKEGFSSFLENRPELFNTNLFQEIRHFVLLFKDRFTATRNLRHIGRIITFQHLFRSSILLKKKEIPSERHVFVKLLTTQLSLPKETKPVLGILIGMNLLQDNEIFDHRHIFASLETLITGIVKIKDSFVADKNNLEMTALFYLEIAKRDGSSFTLQERNLLRKRLIRELKGRVESAISPVVMSRNEEEIMRTIVLLSQQLKYVHDIPQAYISFDTQTADHLSFTVIILRLLHPQTLSVKELFARSTGSLKLCDLDTKQVGLLRKKHPKEANIFRVELQKTPFLRKDFSLDLFKARMVVSAELSCVLGEIRDFNGGMLIKQQETLKWLKNSLPDLSETNAFLLEDFYYSLSPALMRTILQPALFKELFSMMIANIDFDLSKLSFHIEKKVSDNHLLYMIISPNDSFKNKLLETAQELQSQSMTFCSAYVNALDRVCVGLIFRLTESDQEQTLCQSIEIAMENWNLALNAQEEAKPDAS